MTWKGAFHNLMDYLQEAFCLDVCLPQDFAEDEDWDELESEVL